MDLKLLRETNKLTKTQMAKKLRIAKSYYSMLEKGDRRISLLVGRRIHEEFGVPLEDIFFVQQVHANEIKRRSIAR